MSLVGFSARNTSTVNANRSFNGSNTPSAAEGCSRRKGPRRRSRHHANPPYSDIRPWIEKAWAETAEVVVMLLPANRTEQTWWQDLVEPYRDRPGSPLTTEFIRGRLRFLAPGQDAIGANERPPFGCVLLIWNEYPSPPLHGVQSTIEFPAVRAPTERPEP